MSENENESGNIIDMPKHSPENPLQPDFEVPGLPPERVEAFVTGFLPANITQVVDGDTFDASVDLGFDTFRNVRIRLIGMKGMENPKMGIDAFEARGEEKEKGLEAKRIVQGLFRLAQENATALGVRWPFRIFSRKGGSKGSFNRWLAAVFYLGNDGLWYSVGDYLVSVRLAEEKEY